MVEIVFTSGTTAEPRGVVLTHGNLLANLEPIEAGFQNYRRYERWIHPLRILNLLPLSHVFGQMLGIFIPQILGATAVFLDSLRPGDVVQTIRREKITCWPPCRGSSNPCATKSSAIWNLRESWQSFAANTARPSIAIT